MIPTFEQVMNLTRTVSGEPALTDLDAAGLYGCLIQVPRDGLVVEIGCQLGRSSSLIAQLQQAIGFHTVHIDPYTSQSELLKQWVEMMHRTGGDFTHEFTLLCMRTEQAEWLLSRLGRIDLAFIDGDHEAPAVRIDCALVAERIRSGGWLTAHDCANEGLPGVKQGLGEYIDDRWESHGVSGSLAMWRRR